MSCFLMSRKRFIVESVMIDCLCEDEQRIAKVITDTDETYSYEDLYEVAELLNEQQATISNLEKENENLKLKIVSLENEVQRQTNELKNTKKEFTKKKEELNWLKSEDYLKKIY